MPLNIEHKKIELGNNFEETLGIKFGQDLDEALEDCLLKGYLT